MALGANSPGLWQSQLAAVAARQLSQQDRDRPSIPPTLPPPPPIPPQIAPNEIAQIQQALQQQQQNIQQHLQNLLILQQSSLGNSNVVSPPFLGNQVCIFLKHHLFKIEQVVVVECPLYKFHFI